MTFDNPAQVLQLLGGRKLHVLIALFVLMGDGRLPCGEMDVAALVGCNRKTARGTLAALAVLGLAARGAYRQKETWTLTNLAHQLPLPLLTGNHLGTAVIGEGKSYPYGATTTTLNIEEGSAASAAAAEAALREGKSYPHGGKLSTGYPQDEKDGVLAALHRAGVFWPTDARLAALDWVTAEYVAAHERLMRERGDRVDLLVHRIRCGDPMPVFGNGSLCPVCGEALYDSECLFCAGIIER